MESNHDERPSARSDQLLSTDVDGEVVVYDLLLDQSHLLSAGTAAVWRLCDGSRSIRQIGEAVFASYDHDTAEQLTAEALQQLGDAGLLAAPVTLPRPGLLTRRSVLRGIGVAAVAVPMLTTLSAAPAAAASCVGVACNNSNGTLCPTNLTGVCTCDKPSGNGNCIAV